jgi:hypothetical protein
MDQHQLDEENQRAALFHSSAPSSSLGADGEEERETVPLLSCKMADDKSDTVQVSEDTAHQISIGNFSSTVLC